MFLESAVSLPQVFETGESTAKVTIHTFLVICIYNNKMEITYPCSHACEKYLQDHSYTIHELESSYLQDLQQYKWKIVFM